MIGEKPVFLSRKYRRPQNGFEVRRLAVSAVARLVRHCLGAEGTKTVSLKHLPDFTRHPSFVKSRR